MKQAGQYILLCSILIVLVSCNKPEIKISYLGHSAFMINFDDEVTVLTDYGKPNAWLEYGWDSPIYSIGNAAPDIVTYSHSHQDHCDASRIDTSSVLVCSNGKGIKYKGLGIEAISTSEKDIHKPDNYSYLFEYKGIKILHLGDCQANIMSIYDTAVNNSFLESFPDDLDILLFPIEGNNKFLKQATRLIELTSADIYIPMHYWSNNYKDEFMYACSRLEGVRTVNAKESCFSYRFQGKQKTRTVVNIIPGDYTVNLEKKGRN